MRISSVQYEQGICVVCKKNKQTSSGICKKGENTGRKIYKKTCSTCSIKASKVRHSKFKTKVKKKAQIKRRPWILFKGDKCENCGFVPIHPCQLDVDHIDGNNKNNDPHNYRTLCANCHRLKTFINKDWKKI